MPKVFGLVRESYGKLEPIAFVERVITEHSDALPTYSTMCN